MADLDKIYRVFLKWWGFLWELRWVSELPNATTNVTLHLKVELAEGRKTWKSKAMHLAGLLSVPGNRKCYRQLQTIKITYISVSTNICSWWGVQEKIFAIDACACVNVCWMCLCVCVHIRQQRCKRQTKQEQCRFLSR